ncbi:alkane 1-monooxygenase [Cognatishimia activa]|uniref:alkane 1-monooxygenase n=1 Tax=Cognatishimia activa TaxID=1715691 RepID=UPI00222E5BC6|nr:alkane 1-monooxygenase [Cognatishimia activa]UZD89866.1 alkane 1-monooxygenase [Cognatishimia activa]
MLWFNLATAVPVLLLTLAGFLGGIWAILAVAYLTVFVFTMDRLIKGAAARKNADGEFPAGVELSVFLGFSHIFLMAIAVLALSGKTGLAVWERIACLILFGQYFGQVSNANAHELIHKGNRWLRRLGVAVYTTLMFGHHASAHVKVHHVFAASHRDPNSAYMGESVYHFWPRAWIGSFVKGLEAENKDRERASTPQPKWNHPYVTYLFGSSVTIITAFLLAGFMGVASLLFVCLYATLQHLASDYIQHYGLRRRRLENGKFEHVGPKHSWNAPHTFSSAMMLNVPRHSDHHMNPRRNYTELRLDEDDVPMLPRSLPVMGIISLWPPLWRAMMDPLVMEVTGQSKAALEAQALDHVKPA